VRNILLFSYFCRYWCTILRLTNSVFAVLNINATPQTVQRGLACFQYFTPSVWNSLSDDLREAALKSRDLTTRHQIKQIATGWTSVGPRKNWTCWTISELNPVCHDSTAALVVACSFCVQSAILSALIRSPTAAGRQQQQQQQQRWRIRDQAGACASSANFRGVGISNSSRGNNLGRLLHSVHRGATCWLRTGAVRT